MNPLDYQLEQLPIPVPPILLEALGYRGEARFFTMHWDTMPEHDLVSLGYWDGRYGHSWPKDAYLLYTSHPGVAPHLAGYELGSDPESALHWLVFDRSEQAAWIGTVQDGHRFLQAQWPPWDPAEEATAVTSIIGKLVGEALREADLSLQRSEEDRRRQAEEEQLQRARLLHDLQEALDAYQE